MTRLNSIGQCNLCKKTVSGTAMSRHLESCEERKKANENEIKQNRIFLLRASAGHFFVYFEIDESLTLKNIDNFLRHLWLECCGHLSAFTIRGISYSSHPQSEYEDRSMNIPVKHILKSGLEFKHEYDFGTTTELNMKCISERQGEHRKEIDILSRNNMPEFNCDKCGKPAKEICQECIEMGEEGLFCESCAKEHEHDEEMFLPVVNSPRMGMCGYTGND